ncbi:MAG: hypothetical protein ACLR1V_16975 [Coprococcus sp.]
MKNDMKRIILILAFILCFGISACGRGSSDGYDAEDSEDHRGSGENESVVYGSTDDGQDKESAEIDKDNPAKQLGYTSIEEMRVQEHEIIASDDSDNTVAEGYWYPDGNRNSLTYIKIQRDTLYWYEFNPEQGDVQVGEADGIVFKLGSKRRLKSGKTLTYTDTSKLNFEECKICFEYDATEYYWRER